MCALAWTLKTENCHSAKFVIISDTGGYHDADIAVTVDTGGWHDADFAVNHVTQNLHDSDIAVIGNTGGCDNDNIWRCRMAAKLPS